MNGKFTSADSKTVPQQVADPQRVTPERVVPKEKVEEKKRVEDIVPFLQRISGRLKNAQTANHPSTVTEVIDEIDAYINKSSYVPKK